MYECPAQASPDHEEKGLSARSADKKLKYDQQTLSMVLFAFLETLVVTGFYGGYPLIMPNFLRHGFFSACVMNSSLVAMDTAALATSPAALVTGVPGLATTLSLGLVRNSVQNSSSGAVTEGYFVTLATDSSRMQDTPGRAQRVGADPRESVERVGILGKSRVMSARMARETSTTPRPPKTSTTPWRRRDVGVGHGEQNDGVSGEGDGEGEGVRDGDCVEVQKQLLHWVGHVSGLVVGAALLGVGTLWDRTGTLRLRLLTM
jgi:hypothetical protein